MRPESKHIILWMILMALPLARGTQAQSRYDPVFNGIAENFPENLVVFTDRTLYAVDEDICFSVLLQSEGQTYQGLGGSVLYAELVSAEGHAVVKGKYPISGDLSSGSLSIPAGLKPGLYYVRCYTRWMRNFGPLSYAYLPVRIVNPFSKEAAGRPVYAVRNKLSALTIDNREIRVSISGSSFHTGEMVDVELFLEGTTVKHVPHACVTVVPTGTIDTTGFLFRVEAEPGHEKPDRREPFQFNFLPEINGTTLSGLAFEGNSQAPASNKTLYFTMLSQDPRLFIARTDEQGRFQVCTPERYGEQEMFLVPESQPGSPVEVRIDNDFVSESLPFDPASLHLGPDELVAASRISLNMQLKSEYFSEPEPDSITEVEKGDLLPFYGKAEISVVLDEFVSLPNMEEVIKNLIPRIFVVRRGGSSYFLIKGEHPLLPMFPPLVLIDQIPVFDMEVILSIPPSKVGHIDVIPELYVLGGMRFGGIISMTSRQKDMAGIPLPDGSYFFDYSAFQSPAVAPLPKYRGQGKIPDTRNTLYWKEHLELSPDDPCQVRFQAASVPGSYLILVRGISSEGKPVYGWDFLKVE